PKIGASQERPRDDVGSQNLAPALLRLEQKPEHAVVVADLRMLGVKADLETEDGGPYDGVRRDHLGLVVLAGRLGRAEPHLDAVGARATLQRAQIGGDHPPQRLGDLVEQRQLNGHWTTLGQAASRARRLCRGSITWSATPVWTRSAGRRSH